MLDCIVIGPNENCYDEMMAELKKNPDSARFQDMLAQIIEWEGEYYVCHDFMNLMLEKRYPKKYPKPDLFGAANMAVFLLANYLMDRNLKVEYINSFRGEKERLKRLLQDGALTVAVTTTYYLEMPPLLEIINFIRSVDKSVKIIVGGPMVKNILTVGYAAGNPLIKNSIFDDNLKMDYFIIEEQGERTLYELIHALKTESGIKQVPNLWFKDGDKIISTAVDKEDNDINDNIIDWRRFKKNMPKAVSVRTSMGCRYNCGFCVFRTLRYQLKSLESLEKEFDSLADTGVRHILFTDDTFNSPINRFKEILQLMIRKKYNFAWASFLRCNDMDEEIFRLMEESGCVGVSLGVESLDRQVLKNMNKQDTNYVKTVKHLNKYNILSFSNFIVGYPGETEESIKETIKIFNENPSSFFYPSVFVNPAGTYIFNQREKYGLTDKLYKWSHNTMDYINAHRWKNHMVSTVDNSFVSPAYSGNVSTIPYLMSLGIPLDLIKKLYAAIGLTIKGNMTGKKLTEREIMDMLD